MIAVMDNFKIDLQPDELSGAVANGVGLVAPFDFALDEECRRWLPAGTPMYATRTPELEETEVTVTLAKEVGSGLAVIPAVRSLLAVTPATIGYACTSGSFVNGLEGERHLQQTMLKAGAPAAVTTSGALLEALQALGIKRLAVATPYNAELTGLLDYYLTSAGYTVVAGGYLDMEHDIARVDEKAVLRMARLIDRPEAEAIFFSCTNLHTYDIISQLEAELGKPVLSANMVTMWAALKAGKLPMPDCGHRLFVATPDVA